MAAARRLQLAVSASCLGAPEFKGLLSAETDTRCLRATSSCESSRKILDHRLAIIYISFSIMCLADALATLYSRPLVLSLHMEALSAGALGY